MKKTLHRKYSWKRVEDQQDRKPKERDVEIVFQKGTIDTFPGFFACFSVDKQTRTGERFSHNNLKAARKRVDELNRKLRSK